MFKFFSLSSIVELFAGNNSVIGDGEYYIGSVGDFLYSLELYKKGKCKIDGGVAKNKFEQINKNQIEKGIIQFPEMDDFNLRSNLFNEDNGVIELDNQALDPKLDPRYSIAMICLKVGEYSHWDESIIEDLKEHFIHE